MAIWIMATSNSVIYPWCSWHSLMILSYLLFKQFIKHSKVNQKYWRHCVERANKTKAFLCIWYEEFVHMAKKKLAIIFKSKWSKQIFVLEVADWCITVARKKTVNYLHEVLKFAFWINIMICPSYSADMSGIGNISEYYYKTLSMR